MGVFNFKNILNGNDRSNKFKKNTIILLLCQVLSIGVSMLLVPLTLGYLGVKEYGIWITIVGLIEALNFLDVGLGHGLRNRYVEAKALNKIDDLKKYVSTTFFILMFISLGIFTLSVLSSLFFKVSHVLNAPESLEPTLRVLFIVLTGFFCLRFVFNITNILLTADQSPAIPAVLLLIGNILSLVSILILAKLKMVSLLNFGFSLAISQFAPLLVAAIVFFSSRYRYIFPKWSSFSRKHIQGVLSLGVKFFFVQLTTLFLFQSNNLIITHVLGLEKVSEFNIAYKYMNILFTTFMTLLTPLWSATTDAYVRGDVAWIKKCMSWLDVVWIIMIATGIAMVLLSPYVYSIWLKNRVSADIWFLTAFLGYFVFQMRSILYRSFMNGVGKVQLQFLVTLLQAIFHVPMGIYLSRKFGLIGIPITMSIWAGINSVWEPIQYKKIILNKARGIWAK